MDNRRDFIKKAALIGGVLGTGSLHPEILQNADPGNGESVYFSNNPTFHYKPLQLVQLEGIPKGHLYVFDGSGTLYIQEEAEDRFEFGAGGSLGNHLILVTDKKGKYLDSASFQCDARTEIKDEKGYYQELLDTLYFSMIREFGQVDTVRVNGKFYNFFVRWLRDHVHTLKGMKYFYPELKTGIELYSDFQREDGMIWDNIYARDEQPNYWEVRFSYGNFIKIIENFQYELKRIPVENDVEYLFLEGLYYTWKATGDDRWMASLLDKAVKAVDYSFNDPYRWSKKYRLLKRGYTIDTWDFQSIYDVERSGDPMVVKPDKTIFGIMYGDNTGMAAGLIYLSEMLEHAGRVEEAEKYRNLSVELKERLDRLSWNGEYYTHHISEDPGFKRDFGVDTDKQVSLSNAYSINRTLSHEQARSVIETYRRIRKEMPGSSPGEWYTIYPPFQRGYGSHNSVWEYMNGGVTSIVAGELAHGAFEHGYEEYGADILNRVKGLAEKTGNYLHCTYKGAMPEEPSRNFEPVSLREIANTDTHGTGGPSVPGWTMEGDNDLHEFPTGQKVFHDIPFILLDPAKNGRKACLGISKIEHYLPEASLKINKKSRSVYILQTRGSSGNPAGKFSILYEDGTKHVRFMDGGRIGNWWYPAAPASARGDIHTVIGWRGENKYSNNVGVYLTGINNPHPDKLIKEFHFESFENDAIWMVLGVTLCDAPVFFTPPIVSYGIPDNWGAAANVYALVEGLAGIKDLGVAYDHNLIAPRWPAAGVKKSDVCIKYEASGGYVCYEYEVNDRNLRLKYTSSGNKSLVKLLLPKGRKVGSLSINNRNVPNINIEKIEESEYLVFESEGKDVKGVSVEFA